MKRGADFVLAIRAAPTGSQLAVGRAFVVASEAVVGRGVEADIRLDDITVSRRHVRFYRVSGELHMEILAHRNGTFLDGASISHGSNAKISHDAHVLQLGGALLDLYPMANTEPVLDPLTLRTNASPNASAPFLEISADGDQCTVRCRGRFLDVHAGAAKALKALCETPGTIVHEWDIQDAVGGSCNVQQLVSTIRKAFRLLIETGHLSDDELRCFIRRVSSGERVAQLDTLDTASLLRRFVLSRRGHGYLICLEPSDVQIVEAG